MECNIYPVVLIPLALHKVEATGHVSPIFAALSISLCHERQWCLLPVWDAVLFCELPRIPNEQLRHDPLNKVILA